MQHAFLEDVLTDDSSSLHCSLQGLVRTHSNPMRLSFKVEVGNLMRELAAQGPQLPATPRAQAQQWRQPASPGSAAAPAPAGPTMAGGSGARGEGGAGGMELLESSRIPSCDLGGHGC